VLVSLRPLRLPPDILRQDTACDPAGVPFLQLVCIPSGVPADTGTPVRRPLCRHRPIRAFRRTPRLIQHQACKTISGRREGDNHARKWPLCMSFASCFCVFRLFPCPSARPGKASRTRRDGARVRSARAAARPAGKRCADKALLPAPFGAFERTTGPGRPDLISRAFYAFTFGFRP
jgi:hypothetical protein